MNVFKETIQVKEGQKGLNFKSFFLLLKGVKLRILKLQKFLFRIIL